MQNDVWRVTPSHLYLRPSLVDPAAVVTPSDDKAAAGYFLFLLLRRGASLAVAMAALLVCRT